MSERVGRSTAVAFAGSAPADVATLTDHLRAEHDSHTTGKGRVLIADSEYGLGEVLALHLSAAGYEPIVVTDGLSALYEVESTPPDVVLLDLHLPQISGFRLVHLLKHRPSSSPPRVIVMTALSFQEAADAVQSGADDFIHKPFLPAEIVMRVEQVLARFV
jgi:two-component system response regulator MtrA